MTWWSWLLLAWLVVAIAGGILVGRHIAARAHHRAALRRHAVAELQVVDGSGRPDAA